DDSVTDMGIVDEVGIAIGGEGVATRNGVPRGDAEEAGEGQRDGDDLVELLRE
ncbi:hypothetical protein ALC62_05249, partial [Cyphomyrmex costatus]